MLSLIAALVLAPPQIALPVRQLKLTDNRPKMWKASTGYPVFGGGSPLAAFANREVKRAAAARLAEFRKTALEYRQGGPMPATDWYFKSTPNVQVARPDLISVYFASAEFLGGVHGSGGFHSHNFALVGGRPKRLRLQDLFRAGVNGRKVVSDLVMASLRRHERADFVREGSVKSLTAAQVENFSLGPRGLMYFFQAGDMGSYAVGDVDVTIPFSAMRNSLNRNGPLRPLLH